MSIYAGLKLTAIGWGRTSNNATAKRPDTPYSIDLRILNDLECEKLYHYYNSTYNICVEGNELYSICRGDSGGPLIKIDSQSNDYVAVGLISYGKKCNNPTVLTRLSYYVDWINIHLNAIH
ncbi:tryptase-like [Teleopsis dalmanni]|uniref:tryptase-like n=1 Tax=Teleopsis dalmanni TaxID=139649 RepID=UPI0018CFCED0|nr:tryptase-like [Teleopsis dalmanni]